MGKRPKIATRLTSLNGAFVNAVIPRNADLLTVEENLRTFGFEVEECVYCGQRGARDWDHFRPIVRGGRPSGHYHTTWNLVRACGRCNQSKGGKDWDKWITGSAKGSPKTRGVVDLEDRIRRLKKYELEGDRQSASSDLFANVDAILRDRYWGYLERIRVIFDDAEKDAAEIRKQARIL